METKLQKLLSVLETTEFGAECWEPKELKSKGNKGYPYVSIKGKKTTAARVVLELVSGKLQDGMCACHTCDNPRCVNPLHLFAGTHADNMMDMVSKGRNRKPGVDKPKEKSSTHPRARLTEEDIRDIRNFFVGGVTQKTLAKWYATTQPYISLICSKKVRKQAS